MINNSNQIATKYTFSRIYTITEGPCDKATKRSESDKYLADYNSGRIMGPPPGILSDIRSVDYKKLRYWDSLIYIPICNK